MYTFKQYSKMISHIFLVTVVEWPSQIEWPQNRDTPKEGVSTIADADKLAVESWTIAEKFNIGQWTIQEQSQKLEASLRNWELQVDDIAWWAEFSKEGEEALKTSIDALDTGEKPNIWTDVTPTQRKESAARLTVESNALKDKIQSLPIGSPERETLERKDTLLGWLINILNNAWNGEGVLWKAQQYEWYNEGDGSADKFVEGGWNSRDTPRCAGYVCTVCKEAWYDIDYTLSSKELIGETGKWHTWFYVDGKCLWGNQWNEVNMKNITKPIAGWITPEELQNGSPAHKTGTPENGSIIVFDRNTKTDTNEA